MRNDRNRRIVIIVALAVAGGALWYNGRSDDFSSFKSIAYPCLPLDTVTTDPSTFIMVAGSQSPPTEHTLADGSVVYPVFSHPDPNVVPLVDGKTLYFPARLFDEDELETPPLPPRNLPLSKRHRFELVKYLSDDTKAQLNSAIIKGTN